MNGIVVVRDGEPLLTTFCDRIQPDGPSFGVSWIHLYPPTVEGERLLETERVALAAVRALGLETGVAFPQLLATPDGRVVVVECAARIGGMMAELIEHALGIDLLEVQLRLAVGEDLPDERRARAVPATRRDPLPHGLAGRAAGRARDADQAARAGARLAGRGRRRGCTRCRARRSGRSA